VNLVRANVAGDALQTLKDAGYWALGADMKGTPLAEVDLPERWVICLGEEQRGLKAKTRSQIDELVAIPISAEVESLNLSVSAGILLYALTS
jgi:23S rRNA (guanosine2251-2'-O)-methyltransferase